MKRTFSSLTEQEALQVAVFIEERNAEIYHRFAEMFVEFRDSESLEMASVFWEMAAEERRHSTLLQENYQEAYGMKACALTDEDVYELVELPRLEEGNVFAETVTDGPGPRERALQVALKAETGARSFYHGLLETTREPRQRLLFSSLAEFEDEHVSYLERKLVEASKKGAQD